ncbi:MAG: DNA polymerase Y family protein, partial [Methylocystis sp.]
RAPLAARLGPAAMTRLDALLCRRREPIVPRFPAPSHIAERRFPDGLTRLSDIEATLRLLCADLCPLLEKSGLGARRLEAAFYRVDGAVKRLTAGTSRPLRDPARLFGLLRERLGRLAEEGLDAGYGFDVLRLAAVATERLHDEQRGLDEAAAGKAEALADVVDQLGARLGQNRVLRLDLLERHTPECAVRAAPAASPAPKPCGEKFAPLARPLRLFERPEPIEAIALAPDGPPLRFRWRRALHETAAFEGPERIAAPWWQAPQNLLARDYFQVVDSEGRRFWLYREGVPGEDEVHARWFLHGLF